MRLSKTFGQTEGLHALFGFFKHGRPEGHGREEGKQQQLSGDIRVASKFKKPDSVRGCFFLSF